MGFRLKSKHEGIRRFAQGTAERSLIFRSSSFASCFRRWIAHSLGESPLNSIGEQTTPSVDVFSTKRGATPDQYADSPSTILI